MKNVALYLVVWSNCQGPPSCLVLCQMDRRCSIIYLFIEMTPEANVPIDELNSYTSVMDGVTSIDQGNKVVGQRPNHKKGHGN